MMEQDDTFTTTLGVDEDVDSEIEGSKPVENAFWNIKYYEYFFNVDTREVVERIATSFVPIHKGSAELLKNKPDLYGPFWICITLILVATVSGNITSYLHSAGSSFHWMYNFNLATYVSIVVFIYVLIIPLVIWLLFKSKNENLEMPNISPRLLELVCIYGYSLSLFIPVALLWPIQITLLQWSLITIAMVLSLVKITFRVGPIFFSMKCGILYIGCMIAIHFVLITSIYFYCYNIQSINTNNVNNTTLTNTTHL